jgi:hypothetical protein
MSEGLNNMELVENKFGMITMDIDVINEAIKYLFGKIYKNKLIEC